MKIYSVLDPEFKEYGRVIEDNFDELFDVLLNAPCPKDGVIYEPSVYELEATKVYASLQNDYYGGLPIQIGYCNGNNNTLNCLEYHTASEMNFANEEFILLLAKRSDITNGVLDSSCVKAFKVPKKAIVEVYATSLHYAPVGIDFKVAIVLPKGTNVATARSAKEPQLWATNKWLYAHKDTSEAKAGAYVGIVGENIKVEL